jgi:hypothetical protein
MTKWSKLGQNGQNFANRSGWARRQPPQTSNGVPCQGALHDARAGSSARGCPVPGALEKDAETTPRDTICVQKFLDSTFGH